MPIYAYKCDACGHQQDVLQKLSDPLLTTCPACGKDLNLEPHTHEDDATDPRWAALEALREDGQTIV